MQKVAETFVQSWRYNTKVEKNNAKHCFDFLLTTLHPLPVQSYHILLDSSKSIQFAKYQMNKSSPISFLKNHLPNHAELDLNWFLCHPVGTESVFTSKTLS